MEKMPLAQCPENQKSKEDKELDELINEKWPKKIRDLSWEYLMWYRNGSMTRKEIKEKILGHIDQVLDDTDQIKSLDMAKKRSQELLELSDRPPEIANY